VKFFSLSSRVDLASAKLRIPNLHSTLDYGSQANALIAALAKTLRHGLGNRTKAVVILHPTSATRPLSQAHPMNPSIIHIGLIHDPEQSSRLVDHGPSADDPDPSHAEQFREFWGDKAELRRFKDGRIVESVVWDVKALYEREHVPSMVIRYLLDRHFGIKEDAVQTWQASFDAMLRVPESMARLYQASVGPPTGFKGAMMAFDQLVKALKALDDEMPLSLVNVSPVSEYLRYTSVFSPVPLPSASMPTCLRFIPSMEVILEFEKSAKWPDDLHAIQRIKLAFFERVASALMNSQKGVTAQIGNCNRRRLGFLRPDLA
jgi:U3 small nucleolar RNA-associated protein 22